MIGTLRSPDVEEQERIAAEAWRPSKAYTQWVDSLGVPV